MYVPIIMKDLGMGCSQNQKTQMLGQWGGVEPEMSEEMGPGNGAQFSDCLAGSFTVGVPMLLADRREVVHNLCMQMSWYFEWKEEYRLLQTGKTDPLLVEKEKWSKGVSSAFSHRKEREDT